MDSGVQAVHYKFRREWLVCAKSISFESNDIDY